MLNKTATLQCKQDMQVTEAILRTVEGTNCCQLMRGNRPELVLLLDKEANLPRVTIIGHLKNLN